MRIGIANDVPIAVAALRRALRRAPEHKIAWIAGGGAEAVAACKRDLPDLILMEVVMSGMSGVEATRQIMRETPCPILLVTASIDSNLPLVFEALGYGALDAVNAPRLDQPDRAMLARPLLHKIANLAKLLGADVPPHHVRLVAIGASAGGPAAVAKMVRALPSDFPAAVVVVQHVDPQFVPGLVVWLRDQSSLPVQEACEDDELKAGHIFVAATGDHLILKPDGNLGYTPEPRDYLYRPSVDVFFTSVARHYAGEAVGVLLTGMGRDGAAGLKKLRERNYVTIAQDQASSAVYGMPKVAAAIGAASEIISLDRIAGRLVALVTAASEEAV